MSGNSFSYLAVLAACLLVFSACEDARFGAREKGALTGAALGAGLGAIVGHQTGATGAGIAIGSGVGALAGGLIGNEIDNQNDALDQRDQRLQEQDRELQENRRMIEELKSRGVDVRSSERGVVVNLPDVLFDFDSFKLTHAARRTVGEIADVVRRYRERRLSVEGHTDSVGRDSYNQRLSEDRASSVADELVASSLERRRLSVRGFGESRPIAGNETAAGRQRNRRVEVIIENR
jgi:outer membrane protein OmpA-like peptidoglycan-associated protein